MRRAVFQPLPFACRAINARFCVEPNELSNGRRIHGLVFSRRDYAWIVWECVSFRAHPVQAEPVKALYAIAIRVRWLAIVDVCQLIETCVISLLALHLR